MTIIKWLTHSFSICNQLISNTVKLQNVLSFSCNRPLIRLPRDIDQDFVNTSFVFHRFVQTKATSGGRNNSAKTFFVVERDPADVRLRVVDLLAGDDGIRWNFSVPASNPRHATWTISEGWSDSVVSRPTFRLRTIGGHDDWSTCHWKLNRKLREKFQSTFDAVLCLASTNYGHIFTDWDERFNFQFFFGRLNQVMTTSDKDVTLWRQSKNAITDFFALLCRGSDFHLEWYTAHIWQRGSFFLSLRDKFFLRTTWKRERDR